MNLASPFGTELLDEIPLARAPLVQVLAQVRYPTQLRLGDDAGVRQVQEALRLRYPILRQANGFGMLMTPGGVIPQPQTQRLWRLEDTDSSWKVTVSDSFLSLDTAIYTNRDDFLSRLEEILTAVQAIAEPPIYDRLGIRYTDRLSGGDLPSRMRELVRSEMLGGLTIPTPPPISVNVSITDNVFSLADDAQLHARWGLLPPNAPFDAAIAPLPESSWILDLDVFSEKAGNFLPKDITRTARGYCEHAYRFFRWAVTNELLRSAGGDL